LIVAYNIGYLASIVPIPAGVGVLDGGLAAALIAYRASPAAAVAAVLVYHALAVWVPVVCGLVAAAGLRRECRPLTTPAALASVRKAGAPKVSQSYSRTQTSLLPRECILVVTETPDPRTAESHSDA
jgi:hypothetical protein